jgi:hypothetical protein
LHFWWWVIKNFPSMCSNSSRLHTQTQALRRSILISLSLNALERPCA